MSKLLIKAPVVEHINIGNMVKKVTIYAPGIAEIAVPGQFLHVRVSDSYHPLLRRPFGISSVDRSRGNVSFIYRIVGEGTAKLAEAKDNLIDCMGPLGNGFSLSCKKPLLVGGGMGIAPLIFLAQALCPRPTSVIIGGRSANEMFWIDEFSGLCDNIHITTDDGSLGRRGFTLDVLPELLAESNYDMIYSCGPEPMLKGVAELAEKLGISCQVSLEEFMACGVGACLSCTCQTKDGVRKKVCTDGPVFWAGEVIHD